MASATPHRSPRTGWVAVWSVLGSRRSGGKWSPGNDQAQQRGSQLERAVGRFAGGTVYRLPA
jgi:hypothetical protein